MEQPKLFFPASLLQRPAALLSCPFKNIPADFPDAHHMPAVALDKET
jgi:hypothetical protein